MRFDSAGALFILAIVAVLPAAASQQPASRLDPGAQARTSTPVVSVTVSAEPSPDGYVVRLTNNRRRAIEAWEVQINFGNGSGTGQGHETFPSDRKPGEPHGPIAPGETREITFKTSRTDSFRDVVVSGVLFDDMHFEGHHATRESWFKRREAYGAEASDWLEALRAAAAAPDSAAAHKILLAKLAEHRQLMDGDARSHADATSRSLDETMAQILGQTGRPDAWPAVIEYLLKKFERDVERAFRHR